MCENSSNTHWHFLPPRVELIPTLTNGVLPDFRPLSLDFWNLDTYFDAVLGRAVSICAMLMKSTLSLWVRSRRSQPQQ